MPGDPENASKFGSDFENLSINDGIICWLMCYRLASSCLVSSFVIVSMLFLKKYTSILKKYLFRGHVTVN